MYHLDELKKLELLDKYKEISKSSTHTPLGQSHGNNLEKFLEKKRKKNAGKEHTRIPRKRRSATSF